MPDVFPSGASSCLPSGSTASMLTCGRGITCTDTSSPTRSAARCPASVAAFTAATSPRTIAVTNPPPIFSYPTSSTLAAFTIASAASTIPTKPLVSIIPNASAIVVLSTHEMRKCQVLLVDELLRHLAGDALDRRVRRRRRRVDLRLDPAHVEPAERAERGHRNEEHARRLLRL